MSVQYQEQDITDLNEPEEANPMEMLAEIAKAVAAYGMTENQPLWINFSINGGYWSVTITDNRKHRYLQTIDDGLTDVQKLEKCIVFSVSMVDCDDTKKIYDTIFELEKIIRIYKEAQA